MILPEAIPGRYFRFCSSVPYQTSGSVPMPCAEKLTGAAGMFSATIVDVTLSISATVLFGDVDAVRPSSAASWQRLVTAKSFASILSEAGRSLTASSRSSRRLFCSSVKSSGKAVRGSGVGDEEAAAWDVLLFRYRCGHGCHLKLLTKLSMS
jgi:hypothetical protein